jgi:putative pyruvate formate lyase activating enzyme
MRIAWMGLHRGEEPPLVGEHGSGTVFFSGCPLHCAYCQNCQISARNGAYGTIVSIEQFAQLCCDLEVLGAANINLVTGTHFIPSITQALQKARELGCSLPVVWNSSGFESSTALADIDPYIDTYLVDLKTLDSRTAARFCGSSKYADIIEHVIQWILDHHQHTSFSDGHLTGTIIRHLVFPGELKATEEVLRWFAQKAKDAAWLSLMVQFVPPDGTALPPSCDEVTYEYLIDLLDELEIEEGFVQELGDNIPWIPDFTRDNPFPEGFAQPLPSFLSLRDNLIQS